MVATIAQGTTLTFLRHSIAAPAENDDLRRISEVGVTLAQMRRRSLEGRRFGLIMHSEKERTLETGHIIASIDVDSRLVPGLWFNNQPDGEVAVQTAYKELGETAPLGKYLEHSRLAHDTLVRGATRASWEIVRIIRNTPPPVPKEIVVVGHGIYHPAVGWMMAGRPRDVEVLREVALAPCEGFTLTRLEDCWGAAELIK